MEEKLYEINFHWFGFFPVESKLGDACIKRWPDAEKRNLPTIHDYHPGQSRSMQKTIQASAAGADGADAEQMRCR